MKTFTTALILFAYRIDKERITIQKHKDVLVFGKEALAVNALRSHSEIMNVFAETQKIAASK